MELLSRLLKNYRILKFNSWPKVDSTKLADNRQLLRQMWSILYWALPLLGAFSTVISAANIVIRTTHPHPQAHTHAKTADFEVLLSNTQKRTRRQFHMFTQRQISRCLERQVLLHNDRFQSILFTWGLNWNFIWAWIQYLGNISTTVLYNPVLTSCKITLLISKQSVAFKVLKSLKIAKIF